MTRQQHRSHSAGGLHALGGAVKGRSGTSRIATEPMPPTRRVSNAIAPGMAVTVEIMTGERRVIQDALAPQREAVSHSGHER